MGSLLKRLCESLGISWVWWQWQWINFKKRVAYVFSMDNNVFRRLATKQKVCKCGALAARSDHVCGRCGNTLPSAGSYSFYRVFGLIMPGVSIATAIITSLIFVDEIVSLLQSGIMGLLVPSSQLLIKMGALYSPYLLAGDWWRLLTCTFLHIGIIHFGFNVMALLSVSNFLEEEVGYHRYISVYLLCGLGGSLASAFLRPYPVIMAGASGAIFGLIGFSISYFHRLGGPRGRDVRSFMLRWACYAFVFGLFMRADNLAHAGGLITGLILGYIMEQREDRKRQWAPVWRTVATILSLVYVLAFVMLIRSWR